MVSRVWTSLALNLARVGRRTDSEEALRIAELAAGRAGDEGGHREYVHRNRGLIAYRAGHLTPALRDLERAAALARRSARSRRMGRRAQPGAHADALGPVRSLA